MPQTLHVENIPDALADLLSRRAQAHGRSTQAEVIAILEQSLMLEPLSALQVLRRARDLGLRTGDEAAGMVREDRDAR
jgi:plasmid stability protein